MARKKKGLPFVVQPRRQPIIEQLGTEESGIIAIERRGYLNVAEKSLVQFAMEDDSSLADMYTLSGRMARDLNLPLQQVLEEITQQPLPTHFAPYEEEISKVLMQMMAYQQRSAVIYATALLISRVDSDWTIEQTMNEHPDLIAALAELYTDEERRSVEAFDKTEENPASGVEKKA